MKSLKHAQIARYGLTRFLFAYFVSELLRQSVAGRKLLENPLPSLTDDGKYDYKSNFKSKQQVLTLRDELSKTFEKDIKRGKQEQFTLPA